MGIIDIKALAKEWLPKTADTDKLKVKEYLEGKTEVIFDESMNSCIGNCVLVQTIGISSAPIFLSIDKFKPKRIIQLATETTKKLSEHIKEGIASQKAGVPFEIKDLPQNGNDLIGTLSMCSAVLQDLIDEDSGLYIVFDLTGGKKTMSSGLSSLIVQSGILSDDRIKLVYIELDDTNKKQRFWDLSNVLYLNAQHAFELNKKRVFGKIYSFKDEIDKLKKATSWLNRNIIQSDELATIKKSIGLLTVYEAFDNSYSVNEQIENYYGFDPQVRVNHAAFQKVNTAVKLLEEKSSDMLVITETVPYVIVNLLLKSKRYSNIGRYAESALYAYRSLELLFDYLLGLELNTMNYLTVDHKFNLLVFGDDTVTSALEKRYNAFNNENRKKDYQKREYTLANVTSGLCSKAQVLFSLWLEKKKTKAVNENEMQKFLDSLDGRVTYRNSSIVVHGFILPTARQANGMIDLCIDLVKKFIPNYLSIAEELRYPFEKLDLEQKDGAGQK